MVHRTTSLLRPPSRQAREAAVRRASVSKLSYSAIGATKDVMPEGYVHHDFTIEIGEGRELFERCAVEIDAWGLQRSVGFDVVPAGESVVLFVHVLGLHLIAPCRVVYRIDEERRHGFAYGTLEGHPERGEEYFGVTIDSNNQVFFVLRAFSKPAWFLARLGGPITRLLQRKATYRYIEGMKTFAAKKA